MFDVEGLGHVCPGGQWDFIPRGVKWVPVTSHKLLNARLGCCPLNEYTTVCKGPE